MLTPALLEQIRVTLSLENVSLASVLECLSLVTGLKYEVSVRNGVTSITFASQANDTITHVWDAPRNFTTVVTGKDPGSASEGGAGSEGGSSSKDSNAEGGLGLLGGVGEDSSNSNDDYKVTDQVSAGEQMIEISPEELRTYFSERGVDFPAGTSIYYSARTRKIKAIH